MKSNNKALIKAHLKNLLKDDDNISDEVGYEAHNAVTSLQEVIEIFVGTEAEKILKDALEVCKFTSEAFGRRNGDFNLVNHE